MFTIEATNFELNIEIKLNEIRLFVPIKKVVPEEETKQKTGKMSATFNKSKTDPKEPTPRPESVKRSDYESQNQNPVITRVIEPIANRWFSLRDFIKVSY